MCRAPSTQGVGPRGPAAPCFGPPIEEPKPLGHADPLGPRKRTPHHGPDPKNRHATASRQPMPVKPGGPTPRLPKHNSPPPREPSPPAGQGALHRTRVKPSQRLSGGTQPEDGAPPGGHAVEGPRPARRRRLCERRPPPHDPRTRGPWMLVPPGFHRFDEAVTTRRK